METGNLTMQLVLIFVLIRHFKKLHVYKLYIHVYIQYIQIGICIYFSVLIFLFYWANWSSESDHFYTFLCIEIILTPKNPILMVLQILYSFNDH